MRNPKVVVLKTDGVNCDKETCFAFQQAGGDAQILHINHFRKKKKLTEFDILVLAGGFSYGDDIASGRVLANEMVTQLSDQLQEFLSGTHRLILGICNGFQILVRTGLLPFAALGAMSVTLDHNESGKFECRWVDMRCISDRCVFTGESGGYLSLPVAHGEGRFTASPEVLDVLNKKGQVVLRYVDREVPTKEPAFPANPNGSVEQIAGICDETGRVFGLMPHPERFLFAYQHPVRGKWEKPCGLQIFKNAVTYVRHS